MVSKFKRLLITEEKERKDPLENLENTENLEKLENPENPEVKERLKLPPLLNDLISLENLIYNTNLYKLILLLTIK